MQYFIDIAPKGDKKVCSNCKHFSTFGVVTGVCMNIVRLTYKQNTQSCKKFEFKTKKDETTD